MNSLHLNRWLTSLLLLTMVVGLLFTGTACKPPPPTIVTDIRISPTAKTVAPGETFTLDVIVEPAQGHTIAGIQFDLSFNSTLVTVDSVTEGTVFNQGCNSTFFRGGTIDNEEGTITAVVCVVTEPGCAVTSSGPVATINFTAGTGTGSSVIGLNNTKVGNEAGKGCSSADYGGNVEVSPP